MTPALELRSVSRVYGDFTAVENLSLTVAPGEFVALLGPSGCGKTTTLRMIAGYVETSGGQILIGGQDATALPAEKRNIGMVFQSYALFPHMTVAENVAFGLEMRKVDKAEIQGRVKEALEMVGLAHLMKRLPRELSGGQQQRVALARAIVIRPSVLLLDEPLSNLDARLRLQMRTELKRIQRETGLTAVLVTHDQEEALALADQMVLLDKGRLEQAGSPKSIFESPANQFVADFMGYENFLLLPERGLCTLRPEFVRVGAMGEPAAPGEIDLVGRIQSATYRGTGTGLILETEAGMVHAQVAGDQFREGEGARLFLPESKLIRLAQ